jgi:hypothetical protein
MEYGLRPYFSSQTDFSSYNALNKESDSSELFNFIPKQVLRDGSTDLNGVELNDFQSKLMGLGRQPSYEGRGTFSIGKNDIAQVSIRQIVRLKRMRLINSRIH